MPYASLKGSVIRDVAARATERASKLHHQLETWETDSRLSAVAFCSQCHLAAHVFVGRIQANGEERCGGSCLHVECAGRDTRPHWSAA